MLNEKDKKKPFLPTQIKNEINELGKEVQNCTTNIDKNNLR